MIRLRCSLSFRVPRPLGEGAVVFTSSSEFESELQFKEEGFVVLVALGKEEVPCRGECFRLLLGMVFNRCMSNPPKSTQSDVWEGKGEG